MVVFDVLLHCSNTKNSNQIRQTYKLWHLADYHAAKNNRYLHVHSVDWYSIIHFNPSPDSMWTAFFNCLQHVVELFVPVKKINKCKSKVSKRYPKSVRNAMAKKRRVWRL